MYLSDVWESLQGELYKIVDHYLHSQQVWFDKDPYLIKDHRCRALFLNFAAHNSHW